MITEYDELDAVGLADLIATGEVSEREVLDTAIARIDSRDPQINAVVTRLHDRALAQIEAGLPRGRFRGVPFLLKDVGAEYAGTPLKAASDLLRDYRSSRSTTLVQRYLAAGLVIVGKASTSEFGLIGTVETRAHGATRNPWDTARSTGGSSGGSAAAVAARMVPAAHAGDGGGSIRIPSSWCGVVGLKPSRARNPSGPAGEGWAGLSCHHAITRSVRDTAALLDVTHGPEAGDPYCAPPPSGPYAAEVGAPLRRLRIGVLVMPDEVRLSADGEAALATAVKACDDLGHHTEPVRLPFSPAKARDQLRLITGAYVLNALETHAQRVHGRAARPEDVERQTWETADAARQVTAAQYVAALGRMHAYGRSIAPYFERFDVLMSPTTACTARPLGTLLRPEDPVDATHARLAECFPFTQIYNQTGQPAISLPLFWSREGLPLGIQFGAAFGREDLLIRLASHLEQALPWHRRRPPGLA